MQNDYCSLGFKTIIAQAHKAAIIKHSKYGKHEYKANPNYKHSYTGKYGKVQIINV
jgi:hypothetical protein